MTLNIRILRCSRRLFIFLVSLMVTLRTECLFPLDAYMVSYQTQSKNLERKVRIPWVHWVILFRKHPCTVWHFPYNLSQIFSLLQNNNTLLIKQSREREKNYSLKREFVWIQYQDNFCYFYLPCKSNLYGVWIKHILYHKKRNNFDLQNKYFVVLCQFCT